MASLSSTMKLQKDRLSQLRYLFQSVQLVQQPAPARCSNNFSTMCFKEPTRRQKPLVENVQFPKFSHMMSSMQTPGSSPVYEVDPYKLLEDDLADIYQDIKKELNENTENEELKSIATYYFGGQGKALRPMVAILIARAVNYHREKSMLLASQRQVAMISEMIHSASLVHDDVIDQSDFRRGKPSVNALWTQRKPRWPGTSSWPWLP